jgi:hypothetical protein
VSVSNVQGQQYKRRTYLVDRRFQLKYMLILVVVGAAVSLLFGALMFQAHVEVTSLMDLPRPAIASRDRTVLWLVIGVVVLMAAALGTLGVLVTHRVAGPLYVLGRYLALLGDGVYPTLRRLRENDELTEIFEQFYTSIEKMKERDKRDAEMLRDAVTDLERLLRDTPDTYDQAEPILEQLRALYERRLGRTTEDGSIAKMASAKIASELPPET